jgi:hypothetical protein
LDRNRFDCRSLRVWRGPERRLYTDLFFGYFSFGIMRMPIKDTQSGLKPVVLMPNRRALQLNPTEPNSESAA